MKLVITPASWEEVKWLSSRLRPEDQREVETASGQSVLACLTQTFTISKEISIVRFEQSREPVAVFGVAGDSSAFGVPWFLGTPAVVRGALAVIRAARLQLQTWAKQYPHGLINLIDARNRLHVKWVVAAGCVLHGTVRKNGHDFIYFTYNSGVPQQCVPLLLSSPELA